MTTPCIRAALAAVAALILAPAAGAQAVSPFHAGQWGIEGSPVGGGGTGGALLFVTPTLSLVFDASFHKASTSGEFDTGFGLAKETMEDRGVDLSFGLRHYVPVMSSVSGTFGAGLLYTTATQTDKVSGPYADNQETNTHGLGAYAEIGGAYLFNPHLSLGASYRVAWQNLSGTYKSTGSPEVPLSGSVFAGTFQPVRVSLYF